MDVYIFEKINNLVYSWLYLDAVGIFLAQYLQYFLIGILLILLFLPEEKVAKNRLMVISAFASVLLSRGIITTLIRLFYHRPRPYVVLEFARKIISETADYSSFPSGHAAFFFALAMGVYFHNKKLGVWYFIAATLIGIARIFVGVHWLTDILAGAVVGIFSAWAVNKLINKFFKNPKGIEHGLEVKNQGNS